MVISNEKEIVKQTIITYSKDNAEVVKSCLRTTINQKANVLELARNLYLTDMNLEEYIDYLYKQIIEGRVWKK